VMATNLPECPIAPSTHRLSPAALAQQERLMAFNWLPAAYAHADWLGPWARLLESGAHVAAPAGALTGAHTSARASDRLLQRASAALLERQDLTRCWLRPADEPAWLGRPMDMPALAQALGIAMLGGWVRNGLEREDVARQRCALTSEQRAQALVHADTLRALPYPCSRQGARWRLARFDPPAVIGLGASCMAALLSEADGSRQRFVMHFAAGALSSIDLEARQRDEAETLLRTRVSVEEATP
jgi:hypothetical protein